MTTARAQAGSMTTTNQTPTEYEILDGNTWCGYFSPDEVVDMASSATVLIVRPRTEAAR